MKNKIKGIIIKILIPMVIFLLIIFLILTKNILFSGNSIFYNILLLILCFVLGIVLIYTNGDVRTDDLYRDYLLKKIEWDCNITASDSEINEDSDFTDSPMEENYHRRKVSLKGSAGNIFYNNKRNSNTDIFALMLKNNDEINEYFKISKRQAKVSFYFSIFACILGFIMLGVAVYGVFQIENIKIAIVGTVSGAITEVIAGTVLIIHNKSALQLNHYYDALHQDERFLSAVSMAQQLSDENREDMYMEIIRKQIEVAANDTNHEKTIDITKGSEENT